MTISDKKAALEKQRKKYDKSFKKWNDDMLDWEHKKADKMEARIKAKNKTGKHRNPNRTCIMDVL